MIRIYLSNVVVKNCWKAANGRLKHIHPQKQNKKNNWQTFCPTNEDKIITFATFSTFFTFFLRFYQRFDTKPEENNNRNILVFNHIAELSAR